MSRGNTPIAERLDHVVRSMPEGIAVRHRDLIPRALVVRVASSLSSFVHLVETGSGRAIGIAERGGEPWDAPSLGSLAAIVHACVGVEVLPILESTADVPACPMLGLVETLGSAGTIRLYLDLGALPTTSWSRPPRDPSVPLVLAIAVGSTRLPIGDLRSLAPADLVTIDDFSPGTPRGTVDGVPLLYEFVMEEDRLIHRGATAYAEDDEDERVTAAIALADDGHADDLAPIDSAHITIQLELARIATTVGELDALVPGAILATGLPDATRVTLRIAGRAIARGEIVAHDGEPAVRILELATRA